MSEPLAPGGAPVAEVQPSITPTIENPSLGGIGNVLPGGDMSTTAGPGAIAEQKAGEITATQAAPVNEKKGGFLSFLGKLNPVKAEIVDRATADAKPPTAPVEISPGMGLAPGEPKIAKIEVPTGANPALAEGATPPVPGVTPEAQQAEATANKVLGGNSQLPDAAVVTEGTSVSPSEVATTTGTPGSLDAAMDEIHKTAEESWNKTETPTPVTDTVADAATALTSTPSIDVAPIVPTSVDAPMANSPLEQLPEASAPVADTVADAAAHPEIVDYDKNVAATAGAAEDAANAEKNLQPNLDPLAVTGSEAGAPPVDVPAYTPPIDGLPNADATVSSLPEAQTTSTDPLAVGPAEIPTAPTSNAAPEILSPIADPATSTEVAPGALPIEGTAAPAIENPVPAEAVNNTIEPSTIGSQEPTTPNEVLTPSVDTAANAITGATGNTPIEAIATPLPNANTSNESQWSASNLTGTTTSTEAPTLEPVSPTNPNESIPTASPTDVIQSLEVAPQASPVQVEAPDGLTVPAVSEPITPEPIAPAVTETITTTPVPETITNAASDTAEATPDTATDNILPFPAATLETQPSSTAPEIAADLNTTTTIGADIAPITTMPETPTDQPAPDVLAQSADTTTNAEASNSALPADVSAAPSIENPGLSSVQPTPENVLTFPGATPGVQTPEQVVAATSGIPLTTVETTSTGNSTEDPNAGTGTPPVAPPIAA